MTYTKRLATNFFHLANEPFEAARAGVKLIVTEKLPEINIEKPELKK